MLYLKHAQEGAGRQTRPAHEGQFRSFGYGGAELRQRQAQLRRLDGTSRVKGNSGEDENDEVELNRMMAGRSSERVLHTLALGHLLFRYPPMIEASVCHWMSWRIYNHESQAERGQKSTPNVEDAFDMLVRNMLNDTNDLRLIVRRCTDRLMATTRVSYEIATVYDPNTSPHHVVGFALSETATLNALKMVDAPMNEARFRLVLTHLLSHEEPPCFSHRIPNVDNNHEMFTNFIDNPVLDWCHDRSAFFVMLGLFIARYLEQCTEGREKRDDKEKERRANVQLEAGTQIFESYCDMVQKIEERCLWLRSRERTGLPEALQRYDPSGNEEVTDELYYGIPSDVVSSEAYTLLWLRWAFQQPHMPLSITLQTLWQAKSYYLLDTMHEFFHVSGYDDLVLVSTTAVADILDDSNNNKS